MKEEWQFVTKEEVEALETTETTSNSSNNRARSFVI